MLFPITNMNFDLYKKYFHILISSKYICLLINYRIYAKKEKKNTPYYTLIPFRIYINFVTK